MDDMSFGIAFGLKRRAEGAERGMRSLNEAVDAAVQDVVELAAKLRVANTKIAELQAYLAIEKSEHAGRNAQVEAMKLEHKTSSLLSDSGKRFSSPGAVGVIKTKLRLIFEIAFDKCAIAQGIVNPATRRPN